MPHFWDLRNGTSGYSQSDRAITRNLVSLNYEDNFFDMVDDLLWTAVRYADGPLRRYMKEDATFTKFCDEIESFEALFKADLNVLTGDRPSPWIPEFVRNYLHQQLEKDINLLDYQLPNSIDSLDFILTTRMLAEEDFKVGVVIGLVMHLLHLVDLYGPTSRPGDTRRAPEDNHGAKYDAFKLVEKSIGNNPGFVWHFTENRRKEYHFAVSHKHASSMDRCQGSPNNESSTCSIGTSCSYFEESGDNGSHSFHVVRWALGFKEHTPAEETLCAFHGEAAASSVLNPSKDTDPRAHTCSTSPHVCTASFWGFKIGEEVENLVQELLEQTSTELEQPISVASTVGLQLNEPITLPLLHGSNIGRLPSPSSYFGTLAN
ncbi:hypothetical protein F4823DRAFT_634245 [Ustulina deusta]|nr:hypothetical protein F4823DRAFT_634245 [Ustulina deusta]